MTLLIPTSSAAPAYKFQIVLEDQAYNFVFKWNDTFDFWIFDIADVGGNEIVCGVKVILDYPLINRFANPLLPPGEIVAIDSTETLLRVGRDDMGSKVNLYYFPASELQ